MTWALISNVAAGSTTGDNVTTAAMDTTGANFLVLSLSYLTAQSVTISDSKGNTWTPRTAANGNLSSSRLYYVEAPTVGTGHTFTATSTGGVPSIAVAAFSGGAASASYDVENGAGSSVGATSLQVGNVTPTTDNQVLITGLALEGAWSFTPTIDLSFTITNNVDLVGGQHFGVNLAYLIETTAAAKNPTWSWGSSVAVAACIATFKVASVAPPDQFVKTEIRAAP